MPPANIATATVSIIPELEQRAEDLRKSCDQSPPPGPQELARALGQARRAVREMKGDDRERAAKVCADLAGMSLDLARRGLTDHLET